MLPTRAPCFVKRVDASTRLALVDASGASKVFGFSHKQQSGAEFFNRRAISVWVPPYCFAAVANSLPGGFKPRRKIVVAFSAGKFFHDVSSMASKNVRGEQVDDLRFGDQPSRAWSLWQLVG
jgi:hypothetical protein